MNHVTRYSWTEDGYGLIPLNEAGEQIIQAVSTSTDPQPEETDDNECR